MRSHGIALLLSSASVAALVLADSTASAHALPGGGHFAEGRGSLSRDGGRLTVEQDSQTAIIDWRRFSVGKANSVVFDNGHGATLNIVQGGNLSRIAGDLHGTGSVYLINRAGVMVTKNGTVGTQGSFLASSRAADTGNFNGGGRRLHLTGAAKGNVINRGSITTGRNVSLSGARVSSAGTVTARNASLIGKHLAYVSGSVTAKARVETSGAHVHLPGAVIAARNWLIDPVSLKVGGQAANAIEISLNAGTDVTLKTTATNASGPGKKTNGKGDITIAARIDWTSDATLKLDAYHSIYIAKPIRLYGAGRLVLMTNDGGTGGDYFFKQDGRVAFKDVIAGETQGSLRINGDDYTPANSISQLASDISGNVNADGNYALADNYDASPDGTYSQAPIAHFDDNFEGLGNTISHLTIDDTHDTTGGLFGQLGEFPTSNHSIPVGLLRDVTLADVGISGEGGGGLVGADYGTILHVSVTGQVSGSSAVGGLVGSGKGLVIEDSYSGANVTGLDASAAGGLVGIQEGGRISNTHASGSVIAGNSIDEGGATVQAR